jgi:hypothetical protein
MKKNIWKKMPKFPVHGQLFRNKNRKNRIHKISGFIYNPKTKTDVVFDEESNWHLRTECEIGE